MKLAQFMNDELKHSLEINQGWYPVHPVSDSSAAPGHHGGTVRRQDPAPQHCPVALLSDITYPLELPCLPHPLWCHRHADEAAAGKQTAKLAKASVALH